MSAKLVLLDNLQSQISNVISQLKKIEKRIALEKRAEQTRLDSKCAARFKEATEKRKKRK